MPRFVCLYLDIRASLSKTAYFIPHTQSDTPRLPRPLVRLWISFPPSRNTQSQTFIFRVFIHSFLEINKKEKTYRSVLRSGSNKPRTRTDGNAARMNSVSMAFIFLDTPEILKYITKKSEVRLSTSMHSRRMRTARRLSVSGERGLPSGRGGGSAWPWHCGKLDPPPPPWTEWQTRVKILTCPILRMRAVIR